MQNEPRAMPRTDETPPPIGFLTPEDYLLMRHQLRGVTAVELRQIGGTQATAAEVLIWLEAQGLAVSFRLLERMTPPPSRRIVFRYRGTIAEITLAPDVV